MRARKGESGHRPQLAPLLHPHDTELKVTTQGLGTFQRTAPPLTRITWPVMNRAAGDASQRAAAATSCGVPQRPKGVSRSTRCCHADDAPSPHAVLIHPGAKQFTRTGASDKARLLLKAITAALDAA